MLHKREPHHREPKSNRSFVTRIDDAVEPVGLYIHLRKTRAVHEADELAALCADRGDGFNVYPQTQTVKSLFSLPAVTERCLRKSLICVADMLL